MKKYILFVFMLVLAALAGCSQTSPSNPYGWTYPFQRVNWPEGFNWKAGMFRQVLVPPAPGTLVPLPAMWRGDSLRGAFAFYPPDSSWYGWNGSRWIRFDTAGAAGAVYVPGNGIQFDGNSIRWADILTEGFTNVMTGSSGLRFQLQTNHGEGLGYLLLDNDNGWQLMGNDSSYTSIQGRIGTMRAADYLFFAADSIYFKHKNFTRYRHRVTSLSKYNLMLLDSSSGALTLTTPGNLLASAINYPYTANRYLNGYGSWVQLNSDSLAEGSTNLFYSNARARAAISLTTTGSSGAATYNSSTGVLNVPNYTLAGLGGVPTNRTITINGVAYDLSADRSWTVSGGGGTPGGSNTHVQFNNAGSFGGSSNFTWNNSSNTLTVNGIHNAKQIDFTSENGTIGQIRVYTSGTWTSGYGTGWNSTQFFQNFTGGFKWLYGTGVSPGGTVLMTLSNSGVLTPAFYGTINQQNVDADKWFLLDGGAGNRVGVGTGWNAVQYFARGSYVHKFLGGGQMTSTNTGAWALITPSGIVPLTTTTAGRSSLSTVSGAIVITDDATFSKPAIPFYNTGTYWTEFGGTTDVANVSVSGNLSTSSKTIIADLSAGNVTLTLPGLIGMDMTGKVYEIYRSDYTANVLTINQSAADPAGVINNGLSSFVIPAGKSAKLVAVSTTIWKAVLIDEAL